MICILFAILFFIVLLASSRPKISAVTKASLLLIDPTLKFVFKKTLEILRPLLTIFGICLFKET